MSESSIVRTCPPPYHLVDRLEPSSTQSSLLALQHVSSSTALSHPAPTVLTCPPPCHLVDSLEPSSTHRPNLPSTMSSRILPLASRHLLYFSQLDLNHSFPGPRHPVVTLVPARTMNDDYDIMSYHAFICQKYMSSQDKAFSFAP